MPNLLLQIGPLPVYTFGVILAATFVLGVFLFWRAATKEGFASDPIFDLIFLSVLAALVGGRLFFIIAAGDPPLTDLLAFGKAIFRVGEGVYWAPAFLSGLAVFYLYTRRRREWSFFKLADLAVPVLALGQGIGFLGAELTGFFPFTSGGWLAGAGFLGLFVFLELVRRKISVSGIIFCLYLLASGCLLAVSEYLRETKAFASLTTLFPIGNKAYTFGIDLNYLLGVGLVISGVFGLLWRGGLLAFVRGKVEKQLRFKLKIGQRPIRLGRGEEKMKNPSKEFLEEIKKHLLSEERRLEEEEKKLTAQDPFLVPERDVGNPEFMEEAEEEIGHERIVAVRGTVQRLLADTRAALAKLKIGKYGTCEHCGNPIDRARLQAFPQACYCVECEKKVGEKS